MNPGLVIVEFDGVADKRLVFKARGKLAGCSFGLDDDLTPLQQKHKSAAWTKFKEAKAQGLKRDGKLRNCASRKTRGGWCTVCAPHARKHGPTS